MTEQQESVAPEYLLSTAPRRRYTATEVRTAIERVNKELWLVLSLFVLALLLNLLVDSQRMVLALYTLPTVMSAYLYGRRHATLTALLSVLLVALLMFSRNTVFDTTVQPVDNRWLDFVAWGSTLILMAYLVGTLYEVKDRKVKEIRETYHGILLILRHFISKDKYTENHSYRVSVYATKIAGAMELDPERIEDVRAAALLHDIGKLEISRAILYKAARLTSDEYQEMRSHVRRGVSLLEPVGGSLRRVLPIILAHHDRFDGSGYTPSEGEHIPIEARIISVADVYDSLTSDRPYRQAMSPFEAKEIIVKGSGHEFDPAVVEAFVGVFRAGGLEVPSVVL